MNTPTPAQALGEAIRMIEGCRVFVTSREKIKHPEGTDLFDESLRVIKQTAAILADEVERWKSCNKQNACELDDIRSLTRPLFKNVDPMPGDCMIGVNRSVTVYGYVRDVVKQLEIERQHGQHFAELEEARSRWQALANAAINEKNEALAICAEAEGLLREALPFIGWTGAPNLIVERIAAFLTAN